MRDKEVYNKVSYVITNDHIYYTKDTHDIFQRTIATPFNNHLKYVMYDIYCLYCRWKKDGTLERSYEGKNNDSLSNYRSFISVPTRILVSGDLVRFATIVEKNNMSGHWCYWCMLSATEWEKL